VVTAIVSDLHLGARRKADVLRRPELRERLLAELEDVDRLVLLGDTLELREAPLDTVLEDARPFFEDLGEVMAGRQILLSAGNHDHELASRALPADELPLERIVHKPSGPAEALARFAARAELALAYPGMWVRDDVYATHGHYLDRHNTVPAFESVAASVIARVRGRQGATPGDYEAALRPLYEAMHALAQRRVEAPTSGGASMAVYRAINGNSLPGRVLSGLVLPTAVGVLNVTGFGPFHSEITGGELRRASLRAMQEVVRALGIDAEHVVFGHTHRTGPLPGDDDWPAGFVNSGCWVYEPAFLGESADDSPHWPGTLVLVRDDGPPEVRRLLADLAHGDLAPA
jgi:Calcineurin-like phosphoesterase